MVFAPGFDPGSLVSLALVPLTNPPSPQYIPIIYTGTTHIYMRRSNPTSVAPPRKYVKPNPMSNEFLDDNTNSLYVMATSCMNDQDNKNQFRAANVKVVMQKSSEVEDVKYCEKLAITTQKTSRTHPVQHDEFLNSAKVKTVMQKSPDIEDINALVKDRSNGVSMLSVLMRIFLSVNCTPGVV